MPLTKMRETTAGESAVLGSARRHPLRPPLGAHAFDAVAVRAGPFFVLALSKELDREGPRPHEALIQPPPSARARAATRRRRQPEAAQASSSRGEQAGAGPGSGSARGSGCAGGSRGASTRRGSLREIDADGEALDGVVLGHRTGDMVTERWSTMDTIKARGRTDGSAVTLGPLARNASARERGACVSLKELLPGAGRRCKGRSRSRSSSMPPRWCLRRRPASQADDLRVFLTPP